MENRDCFRFCSGVTDFRCRKIKMKRFVGLSVLVVLSRALGGLASSLSNKTELTPEKLEAVITQEG